MQAPEAATLPGMSARGQHVCPICGCEVAPRNGTPKNVAFPFCSPACKVVDLGRWFDGTYRIPPPPGESPGALDEGDGALDRSTPRRDHEEDE